MPDLLLIGVLAFFFGWTGVLLRRSLLVVALSLTLAFFGVSALFSYGAIIHGDADGNAAAVVMLALGFSSAVLGAALAISSYRRRGTIHLDELRQLGE